MTLPKIPVVFKSLPFLLPTYKLHKNNYGWFANAHGSIFALTSFMLTFALMKLMTLFNEWVKNYNKWVSKFYQYENIILDCRINY